jgi:diguanylate cyclase (GGDEF)-like protein
MRTLVARVMDPRLSSLLADWRAAGSETVVAPLDRFAAHRDHLLVIDPAGGGNRYAHYGRAFAEHFGADLSGSVIEGLPAEILPAERLGMLDFDYAYARRMGGALWRSYTAPFPGGVIETWQRLVLPLAGGRLVAAAYPVAPPVRPPDPAEALLRLVIERVPVVLDEFGGIEDLALSLRAFCDSQMHLADLVVLVMRDALPGVANRQHFHHLAALELDHARRMGRAFALLLLDIDHFKRINDSFGHAAGDRALVAFVEACRAALREHDILGRIGGEEFAVALPNTGLGGARRIAERLRRQVAETVLHPAPEQTARFSVSVGLVVCGPTDTLSPDPAFADVGTLLERADSALYRAKAAGRDRVMVYEPEER